MEIRRGAGWAWQNAASTQANISKINFYSLLNCLTNVLPQCINRGNPLTPGPTASGSYFGFFPAFHQLRRGVCIPRSSVHTSRGYSFHCDSTCKCSLSCWNRHFLGRIAVLWLEGFHSQNRYTLNVGPFIRICWVILPAHSAASLFFW